MKMHMLLASAAALAFATGAIAQDAAAPATPVAPDATVTDSTGPDPAASGMAGGVPATSAPADTGSTMAATPDASGTDTAATAPASDAASAAATPSAQPGATDAQTAADATQPAGDAAAANAAPTAQPGAADAQSAMGVPAPAAVDPAKAQAADQMIAQNWSKYDTQNSGQLTPLEFGTWVLAAQGNDMSTQIEKSRQGKAANLPATKVLNATAAEFSKADTNKDQKISQDELKAYLSA